MPWKYTATITFKAIGDGAAAARTMIPGHRCVQLSNRRWLAVYPVAGS